MRGVKYEKHEDRGVLKPYKSSSANYSESRESRANTSRKTPIRSQVLQREKSSRGSKVEPDNSGRYGYVYITENLVNGKKYIGQHRYKGVGIDKSYLGSGLLLKNAISKYGKDNFKVDIIEYCYSFQELNDRERFWIAHYNAVSSDMFYNILYGGYGTGSFNYGKRLSEETKRKISKSKIGHKDSDEVRMKKRIARLGEKNPMYGKRWHLSEDTKKKIGDKCRGRNNGRYGKASKGRKRIVCLETGKVYSCIRDANMDICGNNIGLYARLFRSGNYGRTLKGFHWCYENDYMELINSEGGKEKIQCIIRGDYKRSNSGKNNPMYGKVSVLRKKVRCLELNKTFESIGSVSKFLGIKSSANISSCIKRNKGLSIPKYKSHGYTWVCGE